MQAVRGVSSYSIAAIRRQATHASSRHIHSCAVALSAKNPGPVEQKLREEVAAFKAPAVDTSVLGGAGGKVYSAKIKRLADEIVGLTLLESMDLTSLIKDKLGYTDSDLLFPGGFSGGGAGQAAPAAAAPAPAAEEPAPPKEEKTHVDIKLKAFDQKNKIKVIKEIRGVTSLGLKEAKDLVEAAPCNILQKVKREEALKIIEKLKAETGAELELV